MFSVFDEEVQKILLNSKKEMQKLKHPYVGSEHLILSILKYDNTISKKLNKLGVDYNSFKNKVIDLIGYGTETNNWFLYTPLLKRVLESSILDSRDNNINVITIDHLFLSLLEEGEGIAIRILISMNINIDSLYSDFYNKVQGKKKAKDKKLKILDYGTNLIVQAKKGLIDPVIGREKELNRLIEILSRRRKNNPILLGDAGVGKSALVEELARKISLNEVPFSLQNKKIISVSMSSLVSGTKYRGEFEERVNKIVRELEQNNDIIMFIDEIHTLVGAGGAEGAIDASNILKPALARGNIQIIGATTTEEYKKYIESDRALSRRFQTIMLEEPSPEKTLEIIKSLSPIYTKYHHVKIDDTLLEYIVDVTNRYIKDRKQPDKAIDILDEVCARVALNKNNYEEKVLRLSRQKNEIFLRKKELIKENDFKGAISLRQNEKSVETKLNNLKLKIKNHTYNIRITKEDIDMVVEDKSKVKLFLDCDKSIKIKELKGILTKEIIGQENAINKIIKGTKTILYNYKTRCKPLSFLFIGSTGTGKTYLAKKYSDYFLGKNNYIKLDMSEYKDVASINKLIGSPAGYIGYNDKNSLFEKVKDKPFSVIILDEIEKAHPAVLNLFLQILDDGIIKDSSGRNIYFDNTIIIMTSNVLSHNEKVGFVENNDILLEKLKSIFPLEFLNRIDNIIRFNKLKREDIIKIIKLKMDKIKSESIKKQITLSVGRKAINKIIELSNYEIFGARKIDKAIEDIIDEQVIDNLSKGNLIIKI